MRSQASRSQVAQSDYWVRADEIKQIIVNLILIVNMLMLTILLVTLAASSNSSSWKILPSCFSRS